MSAVALAVLAVALAVLDALPVADAAWISVSVLAAFLPTGWAAPVGWKRRAAEASLIPVAAALLLVADLTVRRMVLPPLLLVAAGAAILAALPRVAPSRRPLLWAAFGLAVRAAVGLGLVTVAPIHCGLALTASAVVPAVAGFWGSAAGLAAGLLIAAVPLQDGPVVSLALIVLSVWLYPWGRARCGGPGLPAGWLPAIAGGGLLAAAVAPWGGLDPGWMFPEAGWKVVVAGILGLVVTARLAPGAAGGVWFLIAVLAGPVQGPTPERFTARLSAADVEVVLPEGTGDRYLLDLSLRGGAALQTGALVGSVLTQAGEMTLRAGVDAADATHRRPDMAARVRHSLPAKPLWQPARIGGDAVWRVSGRSRPQVERGERPVLRRHPGLPADVDLVVHSAGSPSPTPPRDWSLPVWIWGAAVVVALIQLASGGWRSMWSVFPWVVLVVGQLTSRVWVEPLRLSGERYGVDLALAAVIAAWLPAAWRWFGGRRVGPAVAVLLVPLAVATPHLTPSMYGDEPYHLRLMESITSDGDLDVTNNLDVVNHPGDRTYTVTDRLMHSPVLGFLLLPGFVLGGRTGALIVLALAGAALATLIARRSGQLGVPEFRRRLLLLGLVLTYPLVTFATQIWVELPGALMIAAILVAAAGPASGRWVATFVAVLAAAMKTRLGLIAFPAAAAAWWGGGRRGAGAGLLVVSAAAAGSLGFGWLALGHPFGYFRRLGDLMPSDPGLAVRVVGGLIFDPGGGLLFTAPLLLAAVLGAALLWRRGEPAERAVLMGGLLTVVALLHSKEWYGGGSPPGRYLVPLLPALALTWGVVLTAPLRWRRLGELLVAPSLVMWWALVARPQFTVNPGDGRWWLSDALARRFGADAQQFFPSFLVPTTATAWLPPVVIVLAAGAVAISRRRSSLAVLLRCSTALWLAAATALAAAMVLRHDVVVEAEAPQVRRAGGRPVPQAGTFSRFEHRRGWMVKDGEGIVVPMHLDSGSEVWIEGWLVGTARGRGARLEVGWDGGDPTILEVKGTVRHGRVRLPDPPGPGRRSLSVTLGAPARGGAVFDRVVVQR